jgi:hypothetical protein
MSTTPILAAAGTALSSAAKTSAADAAKNRQAAKAVNTTVRIKPYSFLNSLTAINQINAAFRHIAPLPYSVKKFFGKPLEYFVFGHAEQSLQTFAASTLHNFLTVSLFMNSPA